MQEMLLLYYTQSTIFSFVLQHARYISKNVLVQLFSTNDSAKMLSHEACSQKIWAYRTLSLKLQHARLAVELSARHWNWQTGSNPDRVTPKTWKTLLICPLSCWTGARGWRCCHWLATDAMPLRSQRRPLATLRRKGGQSEYNETFLQQVLIIYRLVLL